MQKILVARPIFPDVIERLKQYFDVDWNQGEVLPADELTRRLADKDGALTAGDPIGAAVLAAAPRLRVVSNMAVGYNNFDMAAFNAANVLGTNTPDVLNESTADFGWALMMAAARRIAESEHWLRAGKWQKWTYDGFLGADLYGSTLGVIGMGRIGQALARRAQGLQHAGDLSQPFACRAGDRGGVERAVRVETGPAAARRSRGAGLAVHAGKPSHDRRGRTRADEADRDADQHRARRHRRRCGAGRSAAHEADRRGRPRCLRRRAAV